MMHGSFVLIHTRPVGFMAFSSKSSAKHKVLAVDNLAGTELKTAVSIPSV